MLSVKNVSPGQGATYFKQENYYSSEEAMQHSQWSGKGAVKVELQGGVEGKAFKNLLEGYSPDGNQSLTGKQGKQNRRAAVDCTLSAPKSVSLAALMGGQEKLLEAHKQAVARTLEVIEQRYAQARVWDGEKQQRVNTGNLIVAQFHHTTSREKDPQLHTHCVILNSTQLPDGRWRALSNEELYRNKKLLGAIYRNELAQECRTLGYEIEKRPDELFEIKGYTQEQLEHFSKRREHILNLVGPDATADEKQWAALYQRPAKGKEVPLEELSQLWSAQNELEGLGIEHPVPQSQVEVDATRSADEISLESSEAVKVAIEHCSERSVAFKPEEIEKFVLSEIKGFSYDDLQQAIAQSPELIKTYDERYTTQRGLDRELATIQLMQQGKGQVEQIAHPEVVKGYLQAELERLAPQGKRLTQGQQGAVKLATTTTDQISAWCGVAGAGKTYSLQLLKTIAEDQGYTVKGFAPSGNAAKVLGEELGMEANTVASLLASKKTQAQEQQLWIVDEAGLLNANDGYKLLKRAREAGARIVLVGDYRQMSAVEAGSPFRSLLSAGIAVAQMNESLRQKTPELKKAADFAAAGQHASALSHLNSTGRIEQLDRIEDRTEAIAKGYLKLSPEQRQETLILAGTHREKREIMGQIREELKLEGELSPDEISLNRLKSKDLTSVQARFTHHYRSGDVVLPVRKYKRLGLQKFTPYEVKQIRDDKLLLSDPSGNQLLVDPSKFRKQVYTQEELQVAVGDRLKWTQSNRELGRVNGSEFTVTALEGHTATIEYASGRSTSLYLDQPLHLDYALVSTTYSSQGKTADRAFVSSTVDATVSQESLYVAISRTRHDLKIFAEDVDFLMERAGESSVQRNPVELLERVAEPAAPAKEPVPEAVIEAPAQPIRKPVKARQTPPPEISKPKRREPQQKPPIPKPQKPQPFWTPTPAPPAPSHIEVKHWQELVVGSAIHPDLAQANAESVAGNQVYERLLSTKLEQIGGSGQFVTQPAARLMRAYEGVAEGGWWAKAGIDARSLPHLQPGEQPDLKLWGSFKPDNPRVDNQKTKHKGQTQFIKYEHPLKEERQLFLFNVPDKLQKRIYDKHGIKPTEAEKQSGFWYVAWKYNLPVTVTEGAKKTWASLSQGEITIGLSGVNGGYSAKDKEGNRLTQRQLHSELEVFATPGREFRFAFDHDTKPSTIFNVRRDLVRTGELLEQHGCSVQVVNWKGDKGLDDLIVNQGPLAYAKAQTHPTPLLWETQKHYRGEYTRLSRQVRKQQPSLQGERLDVEVYKLAVFKGDLQDGARAISQGDQARSLKVGLPGEQAQARVSNYVQHIEQQIYQPQPKEPTHERDSQQPGQPLQPASGQPTPTHPGAARAAEPDVQLSDFGPSAATGAHQQHGEPDQGVEPAGQPGSRDPETGIVHLARAIGERDQRRRVLRSFRSIDETVGRLDQALGQIDPPGPEFEQLAERLARVDGQLEPQARPGEPEQQRQSHPVAEDLANAIEEVAEEQLLLDLTPALEQTVQKLEQLENHPRRDRGQKLQQAISKLAESPIQEASGKLPPQVFLGNQPTPEQFTPATNYGPSYKPSGGLWTSAQHQQHGSEWLRFVRAEDFYSPDQLQDKQLWLVQPKPEAKILVVDSVEVLQSLPHLPPQLPGDDVYPLDYEAIAQDYDAMLVKQEVIGTGVNLEVYTFDTESTIWFGARGWPFESVQPLPMPSPTIHSPLTQQEIQDEQTTTQQSTPTPDPREPREPRSQRSTSRTANREQTDQQPTGAINDGELHLQHGPELAAPARAHRAPGAEAGAVPTGADRSLKGTAADLLNGLDTGNELQEVERLAEAIGRLDQQLEQHQRPDRATGSLRRTVEHFHREVADYLGHPEARDLVTNLADALEQRAIEDSSELAPEVEALSQQLNDLSRDLESSVRVTKFVEDLSERLSQQQPVPAQALAEAMAQQGEQLTLDLDPALGRAIGRLSEKLDQQLETPNHQEQARSLNTQIEETTQSVISQLRQSDLHAVADQVEAWSTQTTPQLDSAVEQLTAKLNSLSPESTGVSKQELQGSINKLTQQLDDKQRQSLLQSLAEGIDQSALESQSTLSPALARLAQRLEQLNQSGTQAALAGLKVELGDYTQQVAAELRQAQLNNLAEAIEGQALQNHAELPEVVQQLKDTLERLPPSPKKAAVEQLSTTVNETTQELNRNIPGLDHSLIEGDWQRGQPPEVKENKARLPAGIEPQQPSSLASNPVITQEQEKLNQQALASSKWILRKFGSIQPSGELSCSLGPYNFSADQRRLQVSCHPRGTILESQAGQLTGNVAQEDIQRFKALEKALNQTYVAQSELE